MPYPKFDRFAVHMEPLANRSNKKFIEQDHVSPQAQPKSMSAAATHLIAEVADRVRVARDRDRPVMITFGAHAIKNGLAPVFLQLVREGWITHLATNGAGIIHDWEFAFQGKSCENVELMVREGRFGNWEETGFYINLALNVGAYEGRGYGEAVGAMIQNEGLTIPSTDHLLAEIVEHAASDPEQTAAAADLLAVIREFHLPEGWLSVPHPWKRYSVQAGAFQAGVPFTGHPMIGHDIIYNHPMNHCACVGRTAERDFLTYAESVNRLEGGVYISIGSAVMSPMIFEKSLSMAQNVALQQGEHIDNHYLLVSDLAESTWDWSQGEPPEESPSYYLRYNKSFSRMGGTMRYLQADNRDFLLALAHLLEAGKS
ncbi:MAG: GSU2086 family protein [Pirellulaceae bacterium]